ncbi:MAG: hypothetical protein LBC74_04200, partial [Planctomycetaceae bacterium]|nr:hypothetical protein [Planctomycetaceae bacterium]
MVKILLEMKIIHIILFILSLTFFGCAQEGQSTTYTDEQLAGLSKSKLIKNLNSENRLIVNLSAGELLKRVNRGDIKNIGGKYDIYDKIKRSNHDIMVVHKVALLLSRFPKDNRIMNDAKKDIKNTDERSSIAGLSYLIYQDEQYVLDNYKIEKYEEINQIVKGLFYNTVLVKNARDKWLSENVDNFIKWQPETSYISEEHVYGNNPYRLKILRENIGEYDDCIVRMADKYMNPILPRRLVWLLGEFHKPYAYEVLLFAYCAKPENRTAISLGACIGRSEFIVKYLDYNSKRIFLKSILTRNEYQEIKEINDDEIVNYLNENSTKFMIRNMTRTVPLIRFEPHQQSHKKFMGVALSGFDTMWYPESYKKLNSSDWNTIKNKLEKFYENNLLNDISHEQYHECRCSIARCFQIEWTKDQKKDIAFYAANYVKRCLEKEQFLNGVESDPEPDKLGFPGARFLPILIMALSVEMIGKPDKDYEKILNEIWKKTRQSGEFYVDIRFALLNYLRKNIDSNLNIPDILQRWSAEITPADTKFQILENQFIANAIDEISFMYDICQCKNDDEIIIKALEKLKSDKGININDRLKNEHIIFLVYKVRPDIDPLSMLNFQARKNNVSERYVLISWGYLLTLQRYHDKKQIPDPTLFLKLSISFGKLRNEGTLLIDEKNDLHKLYNEKFEKLINENQNNKQTIKTEQDKKPITQTNTESNIHQEKNIQKSDEDVTIIRPENQGEDFSLLDNAENFKRLTTAEDKFERWKAA